MNDWVAVLECGHISATNNYKTRGVRCGQCREWREVREWSPGYSVQCRSCRYARRFGAARLTALRSMDSHARKHPVHTVQTLLGSAVVSETASPGPTLDDALQPPY